MVVKLHSVVLKYHVKTETRVHLSKITSHSLTAMKSLILFFENKHLTV